VNTRWRLTLDIGREPGGGGGWGGVLARRVSQAVTRFTSVCRGLTYKTALAPGVVVSTVGRGPNAAAMIQTHYVGWDLL